MISPITLKNFETHIDTHINDLHDGVNTFVGDSDDGKSGIVRAIKLNAQNRPQGDSYRNDQLDPKNKIDKLKKTIVAINYKNSGLVIRSRDGGGVNNYQIETEEPLRALRTDVPQEIQDITRMKDFNIQGQHPTEQYFLLADKPGQVAKKFNKVSGLSIIDDTTSEINKQVREINATLKVVAKEITKNETQLKDLKWVPNAITQSKKLKIDQAKLKKSEYKILKLESLIEQLDYVEGKLKVFDGLDNALIELETFKSLDDKILAIVTQHKSISDTLDGLETIDTQLKASNGIESALKEIKQLEKLDTEITECVLVFHKINSKLIDLDVNELDIDKFNTAFDKFEKEFNTKIMTEICPTCGRGGK